MSNVGRVIGIGTLDCMLVHEGDLMVRKEAYDRGMWVTEGSHGSMWIGMEVFGMMHEGEGHGNDVKGVGWSHGKGGV